MFFLNIGHKTSLNVVYSHIDVFTILAYAYPRAMTVADDSYVDYIIRLRVLSQRYCAILMLTYDLSSNLDLRLNSLYRWLRAQRRYVQFTTELRFRYQVIAWLEHFPISRQNVKKIIRYRNDEKCRPQNHDIC